MRARRAFPRRGARLVLTLCLAACAGPPPPAPQAAGAEAAPRTAAAPAPPEEVAASLLPALGARSPRRDAEAEPRFDVAVRDVSAREFFLDLVHDTSYDVVVHPGVEGTISLTLKHVTVPQILEAVREVYGYEFRPTPTGFHVLPAQIQTRIYPVNYLHLQRAGRSQTRVSSGQLSDQVSEGGGESANDGVSSGSRQRSRGVIESSEVRTESQAALWEELAASLAAIVGGAPGRSVVVSPQAGIVVVRAMRDELREVEQFLQLAESSLQRQVILDAKVLEVELSDGYRTGINWANLVEWGSKSILLGQTGGGTLLGAQGISDIAGNTGLLDPRALDLPSNTDTSAFGGVFSAALDLGDFTAFIELLKSQGDVHVLSSPRVATLNNQKAVIKVGSDEFFVTDVSSTTVTGAGAATTTPQITLTPFFSGIALDVLPQISPEGDVILHVHPSVSEVTDQTKQITVANETQSLPLAFSTIRESDSVVRARSGQVVVIGGLMQQRMVDRRAKIPILGDIPLLGLLFQQLRTEQRNSELVILLRPRVVGQETFAREIERTQERLERGGYSVGPGALGEMDDDGAKR